MNSSEEVRLVFATGSPERIPALIDALRAIGANLPLFVVSEFPPAEGTWIPFHPRLPLEENLARCRRKLGSRVIRFAAILLDPKFPYWPLRRLALSLAPWPSWVFFTPDLNHFLLRPRSLPNLLRFLRWRTREWITFQTNPGGNVYTFFWRLRHPSHLRRPWFYRRALARANARTIAPLPPLAASNELPSGVTVVIPSRDGAELLARCLPLVLAQHPDQIIVVDNGSTKSWATPAGVELEHSAQPLSFAAAVNRGIARARFSHVCLLNNDMEIEGGFFDALRAAFIRVPDLFCATAQIFFPAGKRREETGKAVMPPETAARDFPLACPEPCEGEDGTWVLYGSGGCSMYSTARLRHLGGFDETYRPAYVEDLDIGFRAWQRGWPTVFAAGARVVHHHRSTTSRFFDESTLRRMVELNWLRFLSRRIGSQELFAQLWRHAITRLNLLGAGQDPDPVPIGLLEEAAAIPISGPAGIDDRPIVALGSGEIACFPGASSSTGPRVAIATCYLPYPLSHGGAVRMFNLMRRADARGYRQILVCFVDQLATPAPELLAICERIVLVRRRGTHYRESADLPAVVEEFASPAFAAALEQIRREMNPAIWQFEFTQMAQYAPAFSPSILVEHDVTIDLYEQLLAAGGDDDVRDQLERWRTFETQAWRGCGIIVAMSEKDRARIGANAVTLANGVDIERFSPSADPPEPGRIFFLGSFNHLPNLMAIDWFLREVWPLLDDLDPHLHVIAGARHDYYLDFYRDRVRANLNLPRVEVEGFVADVRPAYRRASIVIAPLVASAGTNIKVLEAMAMGKAVVSTPAGVNGLDDLVPGVEFLLASTPEETAQAIRSLLGDPSRRIAIEHAARRAAVDRYSWDRIAAEQGALYQRLVKDGAR